MELFFWYNLEDSAVLLSSIHFFLLIHIEYLYYYYLSTDTYESLFVKSKILNVKGTLLYNRIYVAYTIRRFQL